MPDEMLPPQSVISERALIGAFLIDPEQLEKINFDSRDFYLTRHKWIWDAAQKIKTKGVTPDIVMVEAALEGGNKLSEIGGRAYLLECINGCASSFNAPYYAGVIADRAARRRIVQAASEFASKAYDESSDLLTAVSRMVETLSKSIATDKGARLISEYLSPLWDEIQARIDDPKDIYGVATGFRDFDKQTSGLQLGEVFKLSGEPGVGKSLFAFQVLINIARRGVPVAIYSPEMSGIALARRGLSSTSALLAKEEYQADHSSVFRQVSTRAMRSGRFDENELDSLVKTFDAMGGLPIYISDTSNLTSLDIRIDLARLKEREGVQVGCIDYEGLLEDERGRVTNEIERSKIVSGNVHAIFKDLHLAGLVIDDMNKGGINGDNSGKGGLAGSARKLHDADQIAIMKVSKDDPNVVNMVWEKMREGDPGGIVQLKKKPGYPMFGDMPDRPRL